MSTEDDFTIDSPQWKFLVNDLKNVNRTLTPWVIFTGIYNYKTFVSFL